jgi:hypothetical protein
MLSIVIPASVHVSPCGHRLIGLSVTRGRNGDAPMATAYSDDQLHRSHRAHLALHIQLKTSNTFSAIAQRTLRFETSTALRVPESGGRRHA